MKRRYTIPMIFLAALLAICTLVLPSGTTDAGMTDYCQVPPNVIQNIPPNVLILLDISRSMLNNAYFDGYKTPKDTSDDHACTNTDPCTQYIDNVASPYYGYFDSGQWYTYSNGVFDNVGRISGTKQDNYWSGNFLNWLSMRRIDVMRKVLTGGRPNGTKIDGQLADDPVRGLYKRVTDAQLAAYTPFTTAGNKDGIFIFNTGNSGTSRFDVYQAPDGDVANNNVSISDKITGQVANQSIAVNVTVPLPVEGVLQTVVGARARVGLEFYNDNDGGNVITDVGKDKVRSGRTVSSLNDTINQINLSVPSTNTPLAEALWTATGYFSNQNAITGYSTPAGTGPNYANDYGTSPNSDPMNFGTGGSPRYPICQKNFVLLLTDGEPCSDGKIPDDIRNYPLGKSLFQCVVGGNYQSCPARSGTGYSFPASSLVDNLCSGTGRISGNNGAESGVEDVALFMHTNDLRNTGTDAPSNIAGFQNLTLYTVFAFGQGSTLLKYAAINGGFENSGPTEMPTTGSPSNWDKNGDGIPDTYFEATEGAELEKAVRDAFSGILKRASSGTAASVLASGEGSGANLIQAIFYPRRAVGNDIIWWTGSLQNMWYFVDPFFANATIREDTTAGNVLNLTNDDIAEFHFNQNSQVTEVWLWNDTNGDGEKDSGRSSPPDYKREFEKMASLWEAGKKLWERDISVKPRTIYTTLNGSTLIPFSVGNATLNAALLPDTGDDVTTIINYVRGIDNTDDLNLRPRTVTFGSENNVWRLGDVVNSTPRIVASVPLNKYDTVYNDITYKAFISDNTVTGYLNRGMVFTGGNDGMLHAFRLGKLQLSWAGRTQVEKARITDPFNASLTPQTTLGDEQWAFIPKNALPYLKYLKDPNYCHLYYTDLAPYVFDASIGSTPALDQSTDTRTKESWRTVLIGGMRTGGACDNSASCTTANNCVKTPGGGATGFSSYFALDVTNPMSPSLLWEFTDPGRNLGFATTGPAIVRVNGLNGATRDQSLNGEWYVVFGSGPTGPIDNTNNQFLGRSNQPLKFFVLNLKTGELKQTITTSIADAFAGSMINSVADFTPLDYQDDAIYVGYVKKVGTGTSATWTDGGVGRILTANTTPTDAGTGSWKWSPVIDGTATYPVGPVTSAVARLQNTNLDTNWLFFGTGRYFFENPPTGTNTTPEVDDAAGQRRLFGIKDPCFSSGTIDITTCASTPQVDFSTLTNATVNTSPLTEGNRGWYINLEGSSTPPTNPTQPWTNMFTYDGVTLPYRAERVITDPLATTSGVVFFTTYKPYADECALGGKSFLWALRYNTGDAPSYAVMKGKGLVQVSTASVEQIDLMTAFKTEYGGGMGGRRSGTMEGVPPTAQGLSLLSQPPPVKRIMHMMER